VGEPWLFGPLSRQEAEDLIRQHGGGDGLFLVRKSSSVKDAYAVSCSFEVRLQGGQCLRVKYERRRSTAPSPSHRHSLLIVEGLG
jgi:hypothetical protein